MQVRDSSRELGRLTTVAVVQSIFLVILADALFAVLFMEIGHLMATRSGAKCSGAGQSLRRAGGARRPRHGGARGRGVRHRRRLGHRQVGAAANASSDCSGPQAGTVPHRTAATSPSWRRPSCAAVKARYGVTFQQGALFASLTVHAERAAADARVPAASTRARWMSSRMLKIRLVGLPAEAAGKYPAQLSGGMIKRAPWRARWRWIRRCCSSMSPPSGLDPISAAAFDELVLYLQKATAAHGRHDHARSGHHLPHLQSCRGDRGPAHEIDTLEGIVKNPQSLDPGILPRRARARSARLGGGMHGT